MFRNHVGVYEGGEWGEHPGCEEFYEEQGSLAATYMEHQAERARGPSDYGDQGCCAEETEKASLGHCHPKDSEGMGAKTPLPRSPKRENGRGSM